MTTWNSSVDDPEKHFLGNLLDDDASFSAPAPAPSQTVREHSSTAIPSVSVIAGLGPINVEGSSPSHSFWPEPPPPYSPALQTGQSSWPSTYVPNVKSTTSPLSDLIQTGMQQPYEWDTFLENDTPFFPPGAQSTKNAGVVRQTQIHHHHHSLHHHTHMHSVVENHHHYIDGAKAEVQKDTRKSSNGTSSQPQPFSSIIGKPMEKPAPMAPHSAPVVHKMPFSYRDVAARHESANNGYSPPQKPHKPNAPTESDSRSDSAPSLDTVTPESECTQYTRTNSKGKSEQVQEFQQISRNRKRSAKEKVTIVESVPLATRDRQPKIPVPTRYHVLEKLSHASPKIVKNENVDVEESQSDHPPSAVAVRSRSSSCCIGDDEDAANPARRASKKRMTAPKKRAPRRKNNSSWGYILLVWSYLICAWEALQNGFKWFMTLIVDVCSNMADISIFAFFAVLNCVVNTCRHAVVGAYLEIRNFLLSLSFFDVRSIFSPSPQEDLKWGLDDNMAIPATAEDALERLLRVQSVDAYSVLGLRADCSDDEIRRYHKKLSALYSSDKTYVDGMEEAQDLVAKAFLAIGNPEARKMYNLITLHKNRAHKDIVCLWEAVRDCVEEARHSMYCDCGRRHARIPTNIRPHEARYCRRCGTRHLARSNDIWVESSLLGFVWRYYTCSEGVVYEITDWASCETNYLKHLRPNAHAVQYRLMSPSVVNNDRFPLRDIIDTIEQDVFSNRAGSAQVSFLPLEHREEDKSRRAANRRQKRR